MFVLVVDDDIMITDIMYDFITMAEPTAVVATAHSGEVALKIMSTFKVDLVLTDLKGCCGEKIYHKAVEAGSRVVLCTGDITASHKFSNAEILLKPFSYDSILKAVLEGKGDDR